MICEGNVLVNLDVIFGPLRICEATSKKYFVSGNPKVSSQIDSVSRVTELFNHTSN